MEVKKSVASEKKSCLGIKGCRSKKQGLWKWNNFVEVNKKDVEVKKRFAETNIIVGRSKYLIARIIGFV